MDAVLLFPPGASQLASAWASTIQLGSWLMADPGPDYGAKGLIESVEAQNALRDGGTFAYRRGVIRKMALPLMLNTPSPAGWETALRKAVTPGAIVAVQPEGVPSAQAVYFDIIDGRWEPDYNIFHNRVGVRKGTLYLDTQPWGYWPTEILLASVASMGVAGGFAAVNGASVIGDVPPLADVFVTHTQGSTYPAGNWLPDMVGISFGGQASFQSMQLGGFGNVLPFTASIATDPFAPNGSALVFAPSKAGGLAPTWGMIAVKLIATVLEPAYRGRYRAFMYARTVPSSAPWLATLDSDRTGISTPSTNFTGYGPALASGNQIATVYSVIPTGNPTGGPVSASPAYSIFDMGEITLPAFASGIQSSTRLRLWAQNPTIPAGSAFQFMFGGICLLPVDGAAGILPYGLAQPTLSGYPNSLPVRTSVEWNANLVSETVILSQIGGGQQQTDGRSYYRGVSPRIGASTAQINLIIGDRLVGTACATYPVAQANLEYATVVVSYRPQFQFLAGG